MDMVAIERADVGGFLADVEGIRRFQLHAKGQFKGLNARLQARVAPMGPEVTAIKFAQKLQLPALDEGGRVRAANIVDELFHLPVLRVNKCALKSARQKSRLVILRILDRHPARTHGHETG